MSADRFTLAGQAWLRGRIGARLVGLGVLASTLGGAAPSDRSVVYGVRGWPVGYETTAVDERADPWVAVTDATIAPVLTPAQRRVHRAHRIAVDYDADGVPDVAWMVRNRTQMGVLVRLGATGRTVLAYRADGAWGAERLYRIGRRAVGIEFLESTVVALSSESGRPMVYYREEAGG